MTYSVGILGLLLLLALGLGGLLFVAVLIAIIVKALSKSRSAGHVFAGGFAAVLALLIVGSVVGLFIGMFSVQRKAVVSHTPSYTNDRAVVDLMIAENGQASVPANQSQDVTGLVSVPPQQAQQSTGITVAGTPWTNAVEEFQDFEADVYPSLESAAEALGRRVGARLKKSSDTGDGDKQSIYVWHDTESQTFSSPRGEPVISRDILDAVAAGLRQKLDDPAYVSVERPVSGIVVRVAIQEIDFDHRSNRWGRHALSSSGGLALRVEAPGGPFSVSTRFVDAPWVEDRNIFGPEYAGDWLVAYSGGAHTTHDGAKQDALAAASESLLPLARARIQKLPASDQHNFIRQIQKNPDWLRDRISAELVSGNQMMHRFAQRYDRPYGATIWREAILVDASSVKVETIARSLIQGVESRVAHTRTTFLSFVGLGVLVFGTYLFLNMATKGYYVWALRFAAVGGLAVAGFVVTHLL